MALPAADDLRDLLSWEPSHGVLSVYLHIDHANRGGSWRIALADALRDALATVEEESHETRAAARATVDRLLSRFRDNGRPPDGRGHVLLVEIASEPGREEWWSSTAYPRRLATAVIAPRPHLQPLIEMLDDHRRRGIVAITGERARVLEWEEEELRQLADEEILTTGDWRERKGQRNRDIPTGQMTTSSGRDLHEQRLDHHRHRFVEQIAEQVAGVAGDRDWDEILCFGEAKYLSELERHLPSRQVAYTEHKNLIPMPEAEIAERMSALAEKLNRRRELQLLERAEEGALAGGRGALGLSDVAESLAQGRVEHLLIAGRELPERFEDGLAGRLAAEGTPPDVAPGEVLIERALQTGAAITPVEDEVAERLAERDGVAAILRY